MITRAFGLALVVLALASAAPASAEIGALDPVPSATLLYPYFETETGDASGTDTWLTVENSASSAQLAHLIVWSDRGVPVLDFDLYLMAHGSLRISMRALISGTRPASMAGMGQSGCAFPLSNLDANAVTNLRAALTGKHMPRVSDENLGCPGAALGDTLARGYVTIDTVTACTTNEVGAGTYWGSKLAVANTLLGSFMIAHGAGKPAYGEQAIHIEASDSDSRTDDDEDSTFYGYFVDWDGSDHRERLPATWETEVLANRSDVIVWRETKRKLFDPAAVGCSTSAQVALDLGGQSVQYFNESEQLTDNATGGGSYPFKRATGRYPVGGTNGLQTPYRSGTVMVNGSFAADGEPSAVGGVAQAVVLSVRRPDMVGDAKNATLALGTAIDNGFDTNVVSQQVPSADYGVSSGDRTVAMVDNRAAASLVLPYFEVSLNDANTAQTKFSIVNTSATAALTKITLYTDRGVPTETFNVYLTGYDVSTIDLRVFFQGGLSNRTASAGQDPSSTISSQGAYSQDINFASCSGILPASPLSDTKLAFLRAAHTGKPVPEWNGNCGGRALDDNIARGYVLIDIVNQCSTALLQSSDINNMFTGQDNLGGSFEVRNRTDGFSYGAPLIPLHAITPNVDSGDMSFYGWLDNWAGGQNIRREPLPNVWRVPFLNDAAVGTTELILFRPVHRTPTSYACDAVPAALGGGVQSLTAYDRNDMTMAITGFVPRFVAGRVPIGTGGIQVPYTQGALEIDLDFQETEHAWPSDDTAHMGFIGVVNRLAGITDPVFVQGYPLHLAGEP